MSTTLVNVSTRPVELHLSTGVTVLQPAERIEFAEEDEGAAQVAALVRNGVLSVLPAEPEEEPDEDDEAADEAEDKPKSPRRGSRRTRQSGDKS